MIRFHMADMDRLTLFSTELTVFRPDGVTELNDALKRTLLAERALGPSGFKASVSGGWHSRPDLAMRREEPFQALMALFVDHVGYCLQGMAAERGLEVPQHRWSVQSWAVVLDRGGYNLLHDHAAAHWSVAWYVDAGDPPPADAADAGALSFVDPRRAAPVIPGLELAPSTFTVHPQSGMLVVFPGALQHYVHPYQGERPRICVSANLRMELTPGR